ncbi:MAG: hypothetical protein OEZ48_13170 [Candidatus Bathyarchaeota archaeon]|nr:hypothetical protein [Candidatus Bathyarchaeota archaeon]MDH5688797.1 hypothetical protein [Candidatus Bathyarchaeota archaeon]
MVPTSGAPEIYVLASIIVFLALSFAAYFSGEYLSGLLPFIYQIIALGGLGEMYVSNFVLQMDIKTRTALSYAYLFTAIANVAAFGILAIMRSRSVYSGYGWSFSTLILQLSDAVSGLTGLFRRKRKRRSRTWIKYRS